MVPLNLKAVPYLGCPLPNIEVYKRRSNSKLTGLVIGSLFAIAT